MTNKPASLVWVTPDAEQLLVHMARVSNPKSQEAGDNPVRLIQYLIKHRHWSPFEMVHACLEINTTRDIGRQILRHRSFAFQEFSQRYAEVDKLGDPVYRNVRLQDAKNRQNSIQTERIGLHEDWRNCQLNVQYAAERAYQWAITNGVAKEVARTVLPEGMTPTRMYMVGSLRSWIHYLAVRTDPSTQLEHREVAGAIASVLQPLFPSTLQAVCSEGELEQL